MEKKMGMSALSASQPNSVFSSVNKQPAIEELTEGVL
jgi:hypothetical protein